MTILHSGELTNYNEVHGDPDAQYEKIYEYEASELDPIVAKPFSPENIAVARELSSVSLDKAYIGSCTGAKLEDLRVCCKNLQRKNSKD